MAFRDRKLFGAFEKQALGQRHCVGFLARPDETLGSYADLTYLISNIILTEIANKAQPKKY